MTVPRPTLTPKQKLTIMARYCRCPGLPEMGVSCGSPLPSMTDCDFDHVHARALGGSDELDNYRPLCRECHKIKTFGRGGEKRVSTADGDVGKIAKVRRLTKAQEENRRRMLAKDSGEEPARKSQWQSRPFPKRNKKTKEGKQ